MTQHLQKYDNCTYDSLFLTVKQAKVWVLRVERKTLFIFYFFEQHPQVY